MDIASPCYGYFSDNTIAFISTSTKLPIAAPAVIEFYIYIYIYTYIYTHTHRNQDKAIIIK